MRSFDMRRTLGVIDIGSNSGRVLVARLTGANHLDILADARSPLRLVRDVVRDGRLSGETISRTLGIVRGFKAVATSAGAERTVALATAAVREATNGMQLIEHARLSLDLPVDIVDAVEEARLGFLGAVHGLPVEHGIVLDVGGGSLQLVHFRGRRLVKSWSLPLGALRLSDRFLGSDPPTRGEMRNLKQYVYERLEEAGVTPLLAHEQLIGTGGSIRNLAKIDRRGQSDYPISRLHGFVLDRRRLDDVTAGLAGATAANRVRTPGLNSDRADSIVGGGLVVQAVMDRLLAPDLTVAGYGLREGVALSSAAPEPASVEDVQRASVLALGGHFTSWDAVRAQSRSVLVERLLRVLQPAIALEACQAAVCAALVLDIGVSIDYYRRHAHAARIVADANLDGFAHRVLALIAAAVLAAGERDASVKGFGPLLVPADQPVVEQVAAAVGLADALVRYGRTDPDHARPVRRDGHVALATPLLDAWPLEAPTRRAERAFGLGFDLGASALAT